jgi:hypothetical protein
MCAYFCICGSDCIPVHCSMTCTCSSLLRASVLLCSVLVCWCGGMATGSALMHAAANGHFSTVRSLLKRGADARSIGSQVRVVAIRLRSVKYRKAFTLRLVAGSAKRPCIWLRPRASPSCASCFTSMTQASCTSATPGTVLPSCALSTRFFPLSSVPNLLVVRMCRLSFILLCCFVYYMYQSIII